MDDFRYFAHTTILVMSWVTLSILGPLHRERPSKPARPLAWSLLHTTACMCMRGDALLEDGQLEHTHHTRAGNPERVQRDSFHAHKYACMHVHTRTHLVTLYTHVQ
jgi:hypothetical protein